jgi:DNA ligase D-like protein (predicted ligase)
VPRSVTPRREPRARLEPAALPFMLPTLVEEVPAGPGWLFELKWDGVRVLAVRAGKRVRLWSRNRIDVAPQYPEVAAAVAALAGGDLALDAEVVALDEAGRPSFQRLQRRMHVVPARGAAPDVGLTAYVFDCLVHDGHDVRRTPLVERKAIVQGLLGRRRGERLRYSDHVTGDGRAVFAEACRAGLEGVVAKRADAPYCGGRRREWLKIKCHLRQEFVIGGYTAPKGARAYLGSVHVGVYDGDDLVYAGRAGSGLDEAGLERLHRALVAREAPRSPFTRGTPPRDRENHWVRPELVCEVRFTEWTADDRIRHPVFLGLRTDKPPRAVRRERVVTPRS